jgi:hypothetical protein
MHNELTLAELDSEMVALLPPKETLFFNWNYASIYASNSSLALNAASAWSQANSAAVQNILVSQH